ncbi:hypothetical protein F5146DRAFT_767833 [Armillaria mellea]|nr:hypothetical protein F5146DRAFT_767833 [Armillaria mellea]
MTEGSVLTTILLYIFGCGVPFFLLSFSPTAWANTLLLELLTLTFETIVLGLLGLFDATIATSLTRPSF